MNVNTHIKDDIYTIYVCMHVIYNLYMDRISIYTHIYIYISYIYASTPYLDRTPPCYVQVRFCPWPFRWASVDRWLAAVRACGQRLRAEAGDMRLLVVERIIWPMRGLEARSHGSKIRDSDTKTPDSETKMV